MNAKFLQHDVICIECGYSLRGLNPRGKCPECGHAILDTLAQSKKLACSCTKIGFFGLGALHAAIAVVLMLSIPIARSGDGFIMLVVLDLPLLFLWRWLIGTTPATTMVEYMIFCTLAGTIMYALAGGLIGLVIDWLRRTAPDQLRS